MSIEHLGVEGQASEEERSFNPEKEEPRDSAVAEKGISETQEKETSLLLGNIDEFALIEQSMKELIHADMSSSANGLEGKWQEALTGIIDWVKRNGRENVPEDVDVPLGNDATGRNIPLVELSQKAIREAKKEDRCEIVNNWKQSTVKSFTDAMKKSWRSRDAINLPMALKVVEVNVPALIDRRAKDYIDGKKDTLPGFVSISWKHSSIFDQITGKPNQITELEINCDSVIEVLADENELIGIGDVKNSQKANTTTDSVRSTTDAEMK